MLTRTAEGNTSVSHIKYGRLFMPLFTTYYRYRPIRLLLIMPFLSDEARLNYIPDVICDDYPPQQNVNIPSVDPPFPASAFEGETTDNSYPWWLQDDAAATVSIPAETRRRPFVPPQSYSSSFATPQFRRSPHQTASPRALVGHSLDRCISQNAGKTTSRAAFHDRKRLQAPARASQRGIGFGRLSSIFPPVVSV
ncbi:hypothetical protein C8Q79DRAFT_695297 [Trametes meyenii]|nr:hypothetical protein C8Q79DRAFT_695297 [Trametes meyenii]